MCASPLEILRSGPPPPPVTLLPDALFFVRAVPVGGGAEAPSQSSVAAQADLALEALAPFPLAQLYHGFYWVPGADRVLIFGAYRRRFMANQTDAWAVADHVLPSFVALLGVEVEPATTILLPSAEGLTAVHWDRGPVPDGVLFQPIDTGASDEDKARAREALLRRMESRKVIELASGPAAEQPRRDGELVFRSGEFISRLPAAAVAAADVRDKDQYVTHRRRVARDTALWRVGVAAIAALCILALGELALYGGGLWQKTRRIRLNAQAPAVEAIMAAQEIANRINDLSSKRLLPMEMISLVGSKKPAATQFLRAMATDRNTLTIDAQTTNPGEIGVFKNDLSALPACAGVDVRNQQTRDNVATFTLVVTFKPGAVVPAQNRS